MTGQRPIVPLGARPLPSLPPLESARSSSSMRQSLVRAQFRLVNGWFTTCSPQPAHQNRAFATFHASHILGLRSTYVLQRRLRSGKAGKGGRQANNPSFLFPRGTPGAEKPKQLKSFDSLSELLRELGPFTTNEVYMENCRGVESAMALNHLQRLHFQALSDAELTEELDRQVRAFAKVVLRDLDHMLPKPIAWALTSLKAKPGREYEEVFAAAALRVQEIPASDFDPVNVSLISAAFATYYLKHSIHERDPAVARQLSLVVQYLLDEKPEKFTLNLIAVIANAFAKCLNPSDDALFDRLSSTAQTFLGKQRSSLQLMDVALLLNAFTTEERMFWKGVSSELMVPISTRALRLFVRAHVQLAPDHRGGVPRDNRRGCMPMMVGVLMNAFARAHWHDDKVTHREHFDVQSVVNVIDVCNKQRIVDHTLLRRLSAVLLHLSHALEDPERHFTPTSVATLLQALAKLGYTDDPPLFTFLAQAGVMGMGRSELDGHASSFETKTILASLERLGAEDPVTR